MQIQITIGSSDVKTPVPFAGLLPQHRRYLTDRGITAETAHAAGLTSVREIVMDYRTGQLLRGAWVKGYLHWKQLAPELGSALIIQFHNLDGDLIDYAQARPDRPRMMGIDRRGRRIPGTKAKRAKFELPVGRGARVYFAPPYDRLKDPEAELIITESPVKALAASQAGLAAIGLLGVNNWATKQPKLTKKQFRARIRSGMTPKDPRELHRDFDKVPLPGRRVYIVFDSDISSNPNVLREAEQLRDALRTRGAEPAIVELPNDPLGNKLGLDDYLHRLGADEFRLLIGRTRAAIKARLAARNDAGRFAEALAIAKASLDGSTWCPRPVPYSFEREPGRRVVACALCSRMRCTECLCHKQQRELRAVSYYIARTSINVPDEQKPRRLFIACVPEVKLDATRKRIGRYDGLYARVRQNVHDKITKQDTSIADIEDPAFLLASLPFDAKPLKGFAEVDPAAAVAGYAEAALEVRVDPLPGCDRATPFSRTIPDPPDDDEWRPPQTPCKAEGRVVVSLEAVREAVDLLGWRDQVNKPWHMKEDFGSVGYSASLLQSRVLSLLTRGVCRTKKPTDGQFLDAAMRITSIPDLNLGHGDRVTRALVDYCYRDWLPSTAWLREYLIQADELDKKDEADYFAALEEYDGEMPPAPDLIG